jgi:hypothetical protein
MTFDPNSTVPRAPEVRVTLRGVRLSENGKPVQVSTRSDFIAPDLSPVSVLATELDKGRPGWTDRDNKPEIVNVNGGIMHITSDLRLPPLTCGKTVIRKAPERPLRVMNVTGPRRNRKAK